MKHIAVAALCLVAVSCQRTEYDPQVLESDSPALLVHGESQFEWNPLTCQQRFAPTRGVFCVGSDNMSDYFILTLANIPTTVGEEVRGTLQWTTPTNLKRLYNISFELMKIDGNGTLWLWSREESISVTVRSL